MKKIFGVIIWILCVPLCIIIAFVFFLYRFSRKDFSRGGEWLDGKIHWVKFADKLFKRLP